VARGSSSGIGKEIAREMHLRGACASSLEGYLSALHRGIPERAPHSNPSTQ